MRKNRHAISRHPRSLGKPLHMSFYPTDMGTIRCDDLSYPHQPFLHVGQQGSPRADSRLNDRSAKLGRPTPPNPFIAGPPPARSPLLRQEVKSG